MNTKNHDYTWNLENLYIPLELKEPVLILKFDFAKNRNFMEEQKMNCNISSLYICVEDMDRAIKFYEDLFEQSVTERDNIYSVFALNGFRFGLFAYKIVNEKHTFGSNCLPSISVENLDILNAKIKGKEICYPLTKIGKNWVVEFVDSEGNHIEMTTSS